MADEIIIDLTEYKDRTGARVTPGRYRVTVEDVEVAQANSGNQMITMWFRILGGEEDGLTLIDRLVQTPNSLFRTVNFMQAIGLPTPRKRLRINPQQFKGQVLDVDVDDGDPYMGKVKSEVRGYMRVAGKKNDDIEGFEPSLFDGPPEPDEPVDPGTSGDALDLENIQL